VITTLLRFILIDLPIKIWKFLVIVFNFTKKIAVFLFIDIPKKMYAGLKKFVNFLKWLFIPKDKKVQKKYTKKSVNK